jgi:polyhydroxybutyrate depolymerase
MVNGTKRHYLLAVPPGYDGTRPVPLVFTFHGLGSNSQQQLRYSRWGQLGETEGFLTVSPDALGDKPRWDFLKSSTDPSSDAAFIDALLKELERTYCVDADRVYSSGMSNGSAVTFGLACRHEEPFAAYGSVAATFYVDAYCGGGPPTSIIYFHGTTDPVVPYSGGKVSVDAGESVSSAPDVLAQWAKHDGCGEPAKSKPAADVELTQWASCDDGSEVAFYSVIGGGHTWPGSVPVARLGPTTASIDATALMWAFFQAHPRRS